MIDQDEQVEAARQVCQHVLEQRPGLTYLLAGSIAMRVARDEVLPQAERDKAADAALDAAVDLAGLLKADRNVLRFVSFDGVLPLAVRLCERAAFQDLPAGTTLH